MACGLVNLLNTVSLLYTLCLTVIRSFVANIDSSIFWFFCFLAVKPSKPRCRMDGKLQEGSDVKLSCKSSDGSDPISYKWERVLDKGKSLGKLPNLALIGKKNNRHYAYMLIHYSTPLQRNATKIHFHISDFHRLLVEGKLCWARHLPFTSSHFHIHTFANTDT